jgi:hypothetical protein
MSSFYSVERLSKPKEPSPSSHPAIQAISTSEIDSINAEQDSSIVSVIFLDSEDTYIIGVEFGIKNIENLKMCGLYHHPSYKKGPGAYERLLLGLTL